MATAPAAKTPLAPASIANSKPTAPAAPRRAPPPAPEKAQDTTTAAEDKPTPPPVLTADRLKGAEYERTIYVATPGQGHTIADLLKPAYWAHCAPKLKPWDHVEVRAEDGTYYAELLVLACDRAWAKMHLLVHHNLSTADVSLSQASWKKDFEVKHSPNRKWHVIRKADRHIMSENHQTEDIAMGYVQEYLKALAI